MKTIEVEKRVIGERTFTLFNEEKTCPIYGLFIKGTDIEFQSSETGRMEAVHEGVRWALNHNNEPYIVYDRSVAIPTDLIDNVITDFGARFPKRRPIRIPHSRSNVENVLRGLLHDRLVWLPEYDEVCQWMENTQGRGLMLMGSCGVGKSLLTKRVIPAIFKYYGYSVDVYHARNLTSPLSGGIIVIDDVGGEAPINDYGIRSYPFAETVEENAEIDTCLICSTNLSADELRAKYGERITDRLRQFVKVVTINHSSFRQ